MVPARGGPSRAVSRFSCMVPGMSASGELLPTAVFGAVFRTFYRASYSLRARSMSSMCSSAQSMSAHTVVSNVRPSEVSA